MLLKEDGTVNFLEYELSHDRHFVVFSRLFSRSSDAVVGWKNETVLPLTMGADPDSKGTFLKVTPLADS